MKIYIKYQLCFHSRSFQRPNANQLLQGHIAVTMEERVANMRAAKDDERPESRAGVGDKAQSLLGDVAAEGDVEVLERLPAVAR